MLQVDSKYEGSWIRAAYNIATPEVNLPLCGGACMSHFESCQKSHSMTADRTLLNAAEA